jgi:hypothetical protein
MSVEELQQNTFIHNFQESLNKNMDKWDNIVKDLSQKLRNVRDLPDLQAEIYAKKQDAVEFHTTLVNSMALRTAAYKKCYADAYNRYKTAPDHFMRTKTETAIAKQVDAEMAVDKCIIDMIDVHAKFIDSVISNLDGIAYGINNRLKIEEIINSYTA